MLLEPHPFPRPILKSPAGLVEGSCTRCWFPTSSIPTSPPRGFRGNSAEGRSDLVNKYSDFPVPWWDRSEVCSAPSLRRSPVGPSPLPKRELVHLLLAFLPSLSLSHSFTMLSGDILSNKALASKSLIQHLLGRLPKLGHFQRSGSIIPFRAPLIIAS